MRSSIQASSSGFAAPFSGQHAVDEYRLWSMRMTSARGTTTSHCSPGCASWVNTRSRQGSRRGRHLLLLVRFAAVVRLYYRAAHVMLLQLFKAPPQAFPRAACQAQRLDPVAWLPQDLPRGWMYELMHNANETWQHTPGGEQQSNYPLCRITMATQLIVNSLVIFLSNTDTCTPMGMA